MKCPICKTKLFCQNSRPVDNYTTIREWGCPECKKVYISLDTLDKEPVDKEAQKKRIERWEKEHGRKSTL